MDRAETLIGHCCTAIGFVVVVVIKQLTMGATLHKVLLRADRILSCGLTCDLCGLTCDLCGLTCDLPF
jgi:hypothetical protein